MPQNADKQGCAQTMREYLTQSAEETRGLARQVAGKLEAGQFLALVGDLGAGKTTFVQGLAEGLGVTGRVSSPTFVLMHCHAGPVPLCHLDAYRVSSGEELRQAGAEEYLDNAVVVVEWADRVPDFWPAEALVVRVAYAQETGPCWKQAEVRGNGAGSSAAAEGMRRIVIEGRGERPAAIVRELDTDDFGD